MYSAMNIIKIKSQNEYHQNENSDIDHWMLAYIEREITKCLGLRGGHMSKRTQRPLGRKREEKRERRFTAVLESVSWKQFSRLK